MKRILPISLLALALGCADKKSKSAPESKSAGTTSAPAADKSQGAAGEAAPAELPEPKAALLDPSKATEKAPENYSVKLETTKGDVIIDVTREWAPLGADRFYNLVKLGYFEEVAFFRVIGGFMAQFGIHGHPKVAAAWRTARIQDDPVKESNAEGMVTFAMAGPNSRTTQIFINFVNNKRLDSMRFAPFGKVRDMSVMKKIYSGYGEGAPRGGGPDQGRLQREGNPYLKAKFANLDYIQKASIISP